MYTGSAFSLERHAFPPTFCYRGALMQVFLAVDGWAKAWEHRRSIRGAARNYAVGRSPPPAVAEQGTQALGVGSTSNRGSSSSHSVKKTLSATVFPPSTPSTAVPERVQHTDYTDDTDDTDEQGGGGGGSVVKDASSSASSEKNPRNLKGRERPDLGAGFTLRGTTAEGTSPQSQSCVGVGRTRETDSQGSGSGSSIGSSISSSSSSSRSGSSSSASGAPPPSLSPSLGMAATAAALVSAPTAAGAAAAARRLTGEEQTLTRRPSSSSSTTPTSNVAATAASHTTMRDTRSDAAPGPPGWRGRECNGGAGEERSTTGVGDEPPKGVAEGVAGRVLQRRASGPAGGEGKQGGDAGEVEVLQRAASFSHPPPPPETPVAGVRKAAAVGAPESSSPIEGMTGEGKGALETMVPIPEEEQAFVDELLMEVRFPLVSTSFLCQGTVQCLSVFLSPLAPVGINRPPPSVSELWRAQIAVCLPFWQSSLQERGSSTHLRDPVACCVPRECSASVRIIFASWKTH